MLHWMNEKIPIGLGNVQITLLLPLWGRAAENRKRRPLLVDRKALEIIDRIDYDFTRMAARIRSISRFEWIARSIHIDRSIQEFLGRHPEATIVNVGCGLDTTFDRVDNGRLHWYDLDLPDVIELRRQFIPESGRMQCIAASFLDDGWFGRIPDKAQVMFIAAGVLYYFEESRLREMFRRIATSFPGSEFVFDAASPYGVGLANRKVIESAGFDERSFLQWGIEHASDMSAWDDRIRVVREFPMFRGLTKGLGLNDRILAFLSDRYRIMYMVHLRMRNR